MVEVLNNGLTMPAIGLGTDEITDNKERIRYAVKTAISAGYRLFDTAPVYKTARMAGEAIREKIIEGVVKRQDLFVVSKLWNTKHRMTDVVPALHESLQELGLAYVDLYLMNWPLDYEDEADLVPKPGEPPKLLGSIDYTETWKGMEDCVHLGLAKCIGLSNFNVKQIARIIEVANIKPAVCQDEIHVMLSQKKLRDYCAKYKISMMAYSPLGNPSYVEPGMNNQLKSVLGNEVVQSLGWKYKKTPAQIALRFLVDSNVVPIPKATSARHIYENIKIDDFELADDEVLTLHKFDCGYRIRSHRQYLRHPRYPFTDCYWA